MPSPTDFNLSPYYDDFNDTKNFHRVLFRPSFAVQARELTQSQTILQDQVEKFGDHVFKKGAMVIPGQIAFDLYYYAIKLSAKSLNTLDSYIGVTLTGQTTGVQAIVLRADASTLTDPETLYIKYIKTGSNNTTLKFADNEVCQCSISGVLQTVTVATTATGSSASIAKGTYYINGYFVSVLDQTIILDKYTNTPSYRIGVEIVESIITSNEDSSLVDNAAGSSNFNAPGAHRFKISLTLTKRSLSSTSDNNFIELLRLENGILQNQVRSTEYSILEDTLARRTYDESGDYTVRDFDLELREHLLSGTNRGIFPAPVIPPVAGVTYGSEDKFVAAIGPGKAYVKGYEIETIGTTFLSLDKTREFSTQNNFKTRFDVESFVYVSNVFGSPDVTFRPGETQHFKSVNLYDTSTNNNRLSYLPATGADIRGTEKSTLGVAVPQIGLAKSRGFEYANGTSLNGSFVSSGLTSTIYKHFLFDIEMFTHLQLTKAVSFQAGEKVTGQLSGATGNIQSISSTKTAIIGVMSVASPSVVTSTAHTFKEGMQIEITGGTWSIDAVPVTTAAVYTVKNPTANTFELFAENGVTPVNVTSFTSGGSALHAVLVLSNISGTFRDGENILSSVTNLTSSIQNTRYGFKGVQSFDFSSVRQIGMAGTVPYTADTETSAVYGDNYQLFGTFSVANNSAIVTGFGTLFLSELRVGDVIHFTSDTGNLITRTIQRIESDTRLIFATNIGASDVSTKTVGVRRRAKIQGANKNVSIFKLPYTKIKTLKTALAGGLNDTNFNVRRNFIALLSANGICNITTDNSNETFTGLSEKDFTVTITQLGAGINGALGDILSLTGNNHLGNQIFTLEGIPTGKTLKLDFGTNFAGHKVKILATVARSIANEKTKTIVSGQTLAVSTQATIQSGVIGLGKADVFKINSIFMSSNFNTNASATTAPNNINITDRFDLDTGQRDNFYDIGRIKLKTGAIVPTGRLLINFDFFQHGTGDYFSVDSYTNVVNYENIPQYISDTSAVEYNLRDCLDFRPRVDDNSIVVGPGILRQYVGVGASTVDPVQFNSDITTDLEYFLKRYDKIFLDKDGDFKVVKGSSSLDPTPPKGLDNAMHLFTLFLEPYTISLKPADIRIEKIDNKRYTMRDIGRLEKRLENVEYYTQLSLLETQAQGLQIQDAEGFDRFKNGFIVDNFTGHGIGDVGNLDYKAAIDMAGGILRPTFSSKCSQLVEATSTGNIGITDTQRAEANYRRTGALLTLPYSEVTAIEQPYASKFLNVNPFNIFTWSGSVTLDPPGDEWKETNRVPDLLVNNKGAFDTMVEGLGNPNLASVELSTVWNEWQDFWIGTSTERVVNTAHRMHGNAQIRDTTIGISTSVAQTRTGVRTQLVPQVVRTSLGDKVLNIAFIPFIRSKVITFTATRMKPNTRVYPYFDNIDVSQYVTPTVASGGLVTNAAGAVTGTFTIPDPLVNSNPRWRTGQRVFRLTSSITNSETDVETSAEADYIARGSLETVQNTVVSTREPRLERVDTNDTRNIIRQSTRVTSEVIGWVDPIAQTFMVDDPGGVFLTSMEFYFSTKDANIPVTLQIREVVNGYPSRTVLPFSETVLNPSSVQTSADGTIPTKFTFPSPCYIQEKTEYCFVLLSNCNNYNVAVARLGDKQINSDRTISENPYAGVMFKSQNGSTWTAEQMEDIKFKINRAEFENVNGIVTLVNQSNPPRALKQNPFRTTSGSPLVTVTHRDHGMHGMVSNINNVTIAGVPAGTYNGISSTQINGTYTTISNVTLDSYTINVGQNATATGDVGGVGATATENFLYDLGILNVTTLTVPNTQINYSLRTTTGTSLHGGETPFLLLPSSDSINVIPQDNIIFTSPRMIASSINETNEMTGSKSLFTTITLSTSNTRLSPVIDTARMSFLTISNRFNDPTVNNTPNFVSDLKSTGTSTAAVYCTRPILLENLSTALDVRLTQNVVSSSSVRVFYRITGADEVRNINDLDWIAFNSVGEEDIPVTPATNMETFKEYKYSVNNLTEFTAFQIKVCMRGTNSSYPPVVRDLRGIALAL